MGVTLSLKPHETFCFSLGHKQLEESALEVPELDPKPQSKCRLSSGKRRRRHPHSWRGRSEQENQLENQEDHAGGKGQGEG